MLKFMLILLVVAVAIPVFAGVPLPGSLDPQVLGQFIQGTMNYWIAVFNSIVGHN